MTTDKHPAIPGLREEAAGWFALMRGPEAEGRRTDFEAWLAADPKHRAAYNRIGETFSLGKALKTASVTAGHAPEPAGDISAASGRAQRSSVWRGVALASVLVLAIVTVTALALRTFDPGSPFAPREQAAARQILQTGHGEVRAFRLDDGSRVTLDSDSRVTVAFTRTRRDLALVQGRARFAVAHEARPFVVAAAGGSVTARGTLFDVVLDPHGGARVDLIEGRVDVREGGNWKGREASAAGKAREPGIIPLVAGHSLTIGKAGSVPVLLLPEKTDWPDSLRDFRSVRLDALVDEANRYAQAPLVLASDDLAGLEVSGTFRIRDTRRLAANLRDLLGLQVTFEPGQIVLAKGNESRGEKNSAPPS